MPQLFNILNRQKYLPLLSGAVLFGLLITTISVQAVEKNVADTAESFDDLFGTPPPAAIRPAEKKMDTSHPSPVTQSPSKTTAAAPNSRVTGFYQNDLAYTYKSPAHLSRFNNTLDLAMQGRTESGAEWRIGGRVNYDATFDLNNYYPPAVRQDQRFEAQIREAYVDFSAGGLDYRLGRQHIIWGEVVGMFFADVVSAIDIRQLVLPDFDYIRIPQWAARVEYFSGDWHAEGVWIPYMSYNNMGKPGAEFYPFNPPPITGINTVISGEERPHALNDMGYGSRLSYIKNGWDISGFYYTANDSSAAFSHQFSAPNTLIFKPVHERIHQVGATLGKDLGPVVLRAEAIYTKNKLFNTTDITDTDGLVKQDLLDYVVGLEWSFPQETRFNVQFFQSWHTNYDKNIVPSRFENGASVMLTTQALHPKLEPEVLFIKSLNRNDWSAQLKMTWKIDGNWRLATGADIFYGSPNGAGLFGQFKNNDRIYTELRYSF